MKHKPIKHYWFIITLFLVILKLVSITSAEKDFNSNTTARRNDSFQDLQDPTVATSKLELLFLDYERYTLNNNTIKDTVIKFENTSIFLSNASVIGSRIMAEGKMEYSFVIENCIFEGSEIVIDSASNVTIINSQFIMEDLAKDEEPNHVIRIYNTGFLYMTDTHFGNQTMYNQNEIIHSKIINSTNLGIKLENVLIAELEDCTFTGIKSEKKKGSAMYLQNVGILMTSCEFYLNIAEHGVIYAINYVNITSRNSSFVSNYATGAGAVFYLTNFCSITNDDSIFQNNSAKENAGVVYARYDVTINNRGCLFQYNSAEESGGAIYGQGDVELSNIQTSYKGNGANRGGCIYIRDRASCINDNSSFSANHANSYGGAIYIKIDVELINIGTKFLSNTGRSGGAVFLREQATCRNNDTIYIYNTATSNGGAIYSVVDAELINIRSKFISSTAEQGGSITLGYQATAFNKDCVFENNYASRSGGAMVFWYGANCTNFNCNFTQNKGISFL